MIIGLIVTAVTLVATWMIYKKMGRQGWEGIVPFYNVYVLCDELYGNGWKMLLLLIPVFNIYFGIKMYIDLANAFNKGPGFGLGMIFLPFIFQLILGFGNATYRDGTQANTTEDFVSNVVAKTSDKAKEFAGATMKDDKALEKLEQLGELKEKGIITEEEYLAKKEELLKRI